MTRLRRPPRPVYRVYSEAEFLAAADWSGEAVTEERVLDGAVEKPESSAWGRVAGVAAQGANPSVWGRVAGLAALTGALAAVAGVVVLSVSRSTVSRGSTLGLSASNRFSRSAWSTPPPSSQPRGRDMRRHGRAPRGRAEPRRLAQRGDAREVAETGTPVVAASPTAATLPTPTPPATPGPTPTPQATTSPATPSPATTSPATPSPATTSTATPPPATASANAARAEFGFERQAG
jgi:hypothetical protein